MGLTCDDRTDLQTWDMRVVLFTKLTSLEQYIHFQTCHSKIKNVAHAQHMRSTCASHAQHTYASFNPRKPQWAPGQDAHSGIFQLIVHSVSLEE